MDRLSMKISYQDWDLVLAPDKGGSIATLRWQAMDVLCRAAPQNASRMACFPLLPYANRISEGRFAWLGAIHKLRLNFNDPRWSLHGLGWQRPWDVADEALGAVRLTLDHAPDEDWPWAFHAEQLFLLDAAGLTVHLSLTNHAVQAVPVGLGFHPYFPRTDVTRLQTTVAASWGADEAVMPTQRLPANAFGDWADGAPVAGSCLIDNAFDGWTGRALIDQGAYRLALTSPEARFFHLYIPPQYPYFCAEPVTQLPNAINRPDMPPMEVLAPGATAELTMRISIDGQG